MSEPYLIAHSVYGRGAFDVAEQMECPECHGSGNLESGSECHECDATGWWWIIPTSGHRAYPFWSVAIKDCCYPTKVGAHLLSFTGFDLTAPPAWPDHYTSSPAPKLDIKSLFKSAKPTMQRRL